MTKRDFTPPRTTSRASEADASRSGGQPLDARLAAEFGASLGHDFSRVRVHTDARADREALARGATAFTVGDHIAFSRGAYAPDRGTGRALIGHELAHVVQQAPEYAERRRGGAGFDAEADRVGAAAANGQPAQVTRFLSPQPQCQGMAKAELQKRLAAVLADLSKAKSGSPEEQALAAERDAIMTALGPASTSSAGPPPATDLVSKPPGPPPKPTNVKCEEPNKSVGEPTTSNAASAATVCSAPTYAIPITYLTYADLGLTLTPTKPPSSLDDPFKAAAIGGPGALGGSELLEEILEETTQKSATETVLEETLRKTAIETVLEETERQAAEPILEGGGEAAEVEPLVEGGGEAALDVGAEGAGAAGLGLGGVGLGIGAAFMISGDTKLNYNWDPNAHKNSYKSTAKQYLYVILDANDQLLKYGTANQPDARYSPEDFRKQFGPGARMEVLEIDFTDVRTIRFMEARLIQRYRWLNGARPPKNKADH